MYDSTITEFERAILSTRETTLLDNLKLDLEWAEANEWEIPICLVDDLRQAIRIIEKEM